MQSDTVTILIQPSCYKAKEELQQLNQIPRNFFCQRFSDTSKALQVF